jgi:hypothetical protein
MTTLINDLVIAVPPHELSRASHPVLARLGHVPISTQQHFH